MKNNILFLGGCALLILLGVLCLGLYDPELFLKYGSWGDLFGGLLNPILTFLAFIGVLYTIKLQKDELFLTREELTRSANALENQFENMKVQNFQNNFYNLTSVYMDIVNSIDINQSGSSPITGKDAFNYFIDQIRGVYNREKNTKGRTEVELIDISYERFWSNHKYELGHYFRFIYNVMRYIEGQVDSELYTKLFRSMLSDGELLIIFYNCMTEQGKNMAPYVQRMKILDNLPTDKLLNPSHFDLAEFVKA